ncbi:MAG: hypothetical protein LUQ22_08640, partial [Methanotrichaceae archaeon]|nr:hypothetical protein [Methanotrichaceae archaeon]
PYSHATGKDGNWDRPDPRVKDFYEWGVEFLLKFPGWETLFNIGADFFLYDLARLPIFNYFTPPVLQLINDAVYLHLSKKETDESKKRRRFNIAFVTAIALFSLLGFYLAGYTSHSSLPFEFGYLLAIILAVVGATRMRTLHLMILASSAAIISIIVETVNTRAGLLYYAGPLEVYLFIIGGWIILMTTILYLSDLLSMLLFRLEILSKLQNWRSLPFIVALALFLVFMYWEGYSDVAGPEVKIMYLAMAALGIIVSIRRSAEWNLSLMVVSIAVGGFMELLGSLGGFWYYRYNEPLAVCFAISWAINSWAVNGLPSLFGVDISATID